MGFRRARGQQYIKFLAEMHTALEPDWYLEIGTQTGASLAVARANSIAIDPAFQIRHNITEGKHSLQLFQQTSDAFFASDAMTRLDARMDLCFLDGMHLFEYLLRDFINAEKWSNPGGAITLHDCAPWTELMAERDWDKTATRFWTGDVWKVVPILKKYRPDLEVVAYNCAPTGLVVIRNLDPESTVLADAYDTIFEDWRDVTLGSYGIDRYFDELNLQRALHAPWRGVQVPEAGEGLTIAIKIAAKASAYAAKWGDYHFADSLAKALRRLGHTVRIDAQDNWYSDDPADVDIVLRGLARYKPTPGRPCLMWVISHPDRVEPGEYEDMNHVFVASEPYAETVAGMIGTDSVTPLLQAADSELMKPYASGPKSDTLFIGMHRPEGRQVVEHAFDLGYNVDLYGPNWQKNPRAAAYHRSNGMPNADIGRHYSGAKVVLNDHWAEMRDKGFVSNRVFDVLSCGSALVTDDVAGIPEDLRPWVYVFSDQESFASAMKAAMSEDADRKQARVEFTRHMHEAHTFDQRAGVMNEAISKVLNSTRQVADAGAA